MGNVRRRCLETKQHDEDKELSEEDSRWHERR
jgi:hypothetical protein